MQCEICHERPATVHITQIIGDISGQQHLCSVCARDVTPKFEEVAIDPQKSFRGFALNDPEMIKTLTTHADHRFTADAHVFVMVGLFKAIARQERGHHPHDAPHLSGAEILAALREFATRKFGKNAKATLNGWGVKSCEDLAQIIVSLANAGVIPKLDQDSLDELARSYDFDFAFPSDLP